MAPPLIFSATWAQDLWGPPRTHPSGLALSVFTLAGLVKTSFMYSATVMGPVDFILFIRCRSIGVTRLFSVASFPELKHFPLQRQGMPEKHD